MDNHHMVTEAPPRPPPSQQLSELIQALEQATHIAKQLPTTSNAVDHGLIFASLNSAHLAISSFLTLHYSDNSTGGGDGGGGGGGGDEPMMNADDGGEGEEMNSKDSSMERVEEKMRELVFIKNKRPKRPLSPTAAAMAERRGLEERESYKAPAPDFDPLRTKLKNLDLFISSMPNS